MADKMRVIVFGGNRQTLKLTDMLVNARYEVVALVPPIEQTEINHLTKRGYGDKNSHIEVLQTDSVNDTKFITRLALFDCDIIVNWGHSERFGRELLAVPKKGVLNIHPGRIPNERGLEPITGAMRNNINSVAQTVHRMEAEFDSGIIIQRRFIDIPNGAYRDEVEVLLRQDAVSFYFIAIENFRNGKYLNERPDQFGTYYPKLPLSDGVINWNANSSEILSLIRSRSPFMPCMAYRSGSLESVEIWQANYSNVESYKSTLGQVLAVDNEKGNLIKTNDGAIWVQQISQSGGTKQIPSFTVGSTFVSNWVFETIALHNRLKVLEKLLANQENLSLN